MAVASLAHGAIAVANPQVERPSGQWLGRRSGGQVPQVERPGMPSRTCDFAPSQMERSGDGRRFSFRDPTLESSDGCSYYVSYCDGGSENCGQRTADAFCDAKLGASYVAVSFTEYRLVRPQHDMRNPSPDKETPGILVSSRNLVYAPELRLFRGVTCESQVSKKWRPR
jgi:hypothetical protein